ncbi:RNA ligase/cyclic nucleotide phosphodiesterase [Thermoascus aurantiacus ATCC 26904]
MPTTTTQASENDNPYQSLISACNDDPVQVQSAYETHRTTRTAQQKAKILDPNFSGWELDEILVKLHGPKPDPTFVDPRHCVVFWARPPLHVRELIAMIQREIQTVAPSLWFMPPERLHMTTLELAHSLTEPEMEAIVSTTKQAGVSDIVDYLLTHRARLIKPLISYDASAMALSFVPAAGEGTGGAHPHRSFEDDKYTYHHLRRDIYDKAAAAGIKVASRYTVPSAHLTIARFVTQDGFLREGAAEEDQRCIDHNRVRELIDKIEEINRKLQAEYWPKEDSSIKLGGEWIVGQEKGLDFRKGRLWYGGGETIALGKGF